jgi:coenzyme PQQ biosynthesis protein PqqD
VLRADEERPGGRIAVLPERGVRVNDSGSEILALCDGARSAQEIAALLRARHPEVEHLEADVHDFLEQMTRLGVVVPR